MPNFNLPHVFHDGTGETASGAQVTEDLIVLKEHIETLEAVAGKVLEYPAGSAYTRVAEVGFGAGPFSATRPVFVVLQISKPEAAEANIYVAKVGGVVVGVMAIGPPKTIYSTTMCCSFILLPNQAFTGETGNLAACQPVQCSWVAL